MNQKRLIFNNIMIFIEIELPQALTIVSLKCRSRICPVKCMETMFFTKGVWSNSLLVVNSVNGCEFCQK